MVTSFLKIYYCIDEYLISILQYVCTEFTKISNQKLHTALKNKLEIANYWNVFLKIFLENSNALIRYHLEAKKRRRIATDYCYRNAVLVQRDFDGELRLTSSLWR